ncbi:ribonuclease H-like domain-containing protein [Tanacetum coccineum]
MKLMQFVMGLDDCYDPIKNALLTRDPLPEVKDAYTTVSREESHRGIPESSGVSELKINATSFASASTYSSFTSEHMQKLLSLINGSPYSSIHANMAVRALFFNGNVWFNINFSKFFHANSKLYVKIVNMGWIIDFGANQHLTVSIVGMFNVVDISSLNITVGHPNGTLATISHVGNLKLTNNVFLYDVLVVLGYCVSLMSVNKLIRHNKMFVGFEEKKCYIHDLRREKNVGTGSKYASIYLFDMLKDNSIGKSNVVMSFNVSKLLWHNRLGHPSDQVLSVLHQDLNISKSFTISVYEVYHRGKQTRDPFPLFIHKSKVLGEVVHLDLWGPYRIPSRERFKYFLTIMDDYFRAVWVYLIKTKDEVHDIFVTFINFVKNQFDVKIKTVRSDNETEFVNSKMSKVFPNLDVYMGLVNFDNVAFVWKELESTYDKVDGSLILNLLQKINNVKQGGSSIADYYPRLNSLRREFEALTKLPKHPIKNALLTKDPLPEVKDAYTTVSREESHKGIPESSGVSEFKINVTSFIMQKVLSLINDSPSSSIHVNMAVRASFFNVGHPNGTLATISHVGNLKLTNNVVLYDVLIVPGIEKGENLEDWLLWHNRLGHPSDQVLSMLHQDFTISVCEVYHRTKQTRDPFPLSSHKSKVLGELVHLDLWGPYRIPSREGFKYFLTVVDDYSKAVWVYLIKTKDEVFDIFMSFINFMKNQFDVKIKTVRSDNGIEFVNSKMSKVFSDLGIIHQTSYAYTPQQYGIAERKHRHLLNVARSLMFQWNELESTFDKVDGYVIFNLLQKINNVKQGGSSIANYYPRLNSLRREFDALTKLPKCVCEVKCSFAASTEFVLHTIDRCFEIVGFPTVFKRNSNSGKQNFNANKDMKVNDKHASASTYSSFTSEQMQKLLSLINDNPSSSIHANMAIIDFGANQHLTVYIVGMFNVVDISSLNITVGRPNGTLATISHVGNLKLTNNVVLYDVLVIPGYFVGLIKSWGTGSESASIYLFDMVKDNSIGKSNMVIVGIPIITSLHNYEQENKLGDEKNCRERKPDLGILRLSPDTRDRLTISPEVDSMNLLGQGFPASKRRDLLSLIFLTRSAFGSSSIRHDRSSEKAVSSKSESFGYQSPLSVQTDEVLQALLLSMTESAIAVLNVFCSTNNHGECEIHILGSVASCRLVCLWLDVIATKLVLTSDFSIGFGILRLMKVEYALKGRCVFLYRIVGGRRRLETFCSSGGSQVVIILDALCRWGTRPKVSLATDVSDISLISSNLR